MFRNRALVGMLMAGLVVLLIVNAFPAHATSITVDPAGGPGVETAINAAIARAATGDSVLVNSGTYRELVHVDRSITLVGVDTGSGMPIVEGDGYRGIEITAGHVRVSGFDVRDCSVGILVEGLSDHSITGVTVSGNRVSGTSDEGIKAEYVGGQTIADNTITEAKTGIGFYQSDGNTITGNTIFSIATSGISASYTGYTITGNNVHNCRAAGIIIGGSGHSIKDNTVNDNGDGIMLLSCSGNDVAGNTCVRKRRRPLSPGRAQ